MSAIISAAESEALKRGLLMAAILERQNYFDSGLCYFLQWEDSAITLAGRRAHLAHCLSDLQGEAQVLSGFSPSALWALRIRCLWCLS